MLVPQSLSSIYLVHFFLMLAIFTALIIVKTLELGLIDALLQQIKDLEEDSLMQVLFFENHPFIVFAQSKKSESSE